MAAAVARRSFGNLRKLPSGRWQASHTDDITGKRIAEGAHLLVVKERLGHSTIAVTADRYGHLYPSLSGRWFAASHGWCSSSACLSH